MKLYCACCKKLVADIQLAKVSKKIVSYCSNCDDNRNEMLRRFAVLMNTRVDPDKLSRKEKSFYDHFNEYFGE